MYKGIIFHLISNAIKFSTKGQNILVQIKLVRPTHDGPTKTSPLKGYLETSIVNFGPKFENKTLKRFKTFAFDVSGQEQLKDMQQGIGIGLSTADSLASALGGRVFVTSSEHLGRLFKTEVKFRIKLTNERFKSSYADDLINLRKVRESQAFVE